MLFGIGLLANLYRPLPISFNFKQKTLRLELIKMKNWQKTRNYRRLKDENGNVIANVITVFGEKIEVSDELFTVYAHMDAHERYIMEEAPRGRVFSLDKMAEDGMSVEAVSHQFAQSAEEILVARENEQDIQRKLELLKQALYQLNEADRALIEAVYFENISMREYARRIGVSHSTITKRRNRILSTLKKYFENI